MIGSNDTVSCFLCLKSLDGWEAGDCAWKEHKSHSLTCPLVTLNLQTSRLRTFDKWPGERVKGGVNELAAAGFFHFPKSDQDDTCICYQCGLALDGWEADDDPHYEHSRRRPRCPHVVKKEYFAPGSFEFILAGKSDELAVKDLDQISNGPSSSKISLTVPSTPFTSRNKQQLPNTVKSSSKKIKISVPSTPSCTTKKSISTNTKTASNIHQFFNIFPSFQGKEVNGEILNLTVEELLDRLIKEKVGLFEEFLKAQRATTDD